MSDTKVRSTWLLSVRCHWCYGSSPSCTRCLNW